MSKHELSPAHIQQAYHYLSSFEIEDKYRAERDAYLDAHLRRFLVTQQFIPPASPGARVLELGAAPYLMTTLLAHDGQYDLCATDYRGAGAPAESTIELRNPVYGDAYAIPCRNFNVEKDVFPYPDGFFDGVLCCELIEHLTQDPTHMLVEIHRVLKMGGWVVVTTPNVLVLRHLDALLRKRQNIYSPYSGYGAYGRHNREWTLDEVVQLLRGCGFGIVSAQIVDTYPHPFLSATLKKIFPHWRDMICAVARTERERTAYYPENLYVSMSMVVPMVGGV